MKTILEIAVVSLVLLDFVGILFQRRKSIKWMALSIVTGFSLGVLWILSGFVVKTHSKIMACVMAVLYLFVLIGRIMILVTIILEKKQAETKYYIDKKTGLLTDGEHYYSVIMIIPPQKK